jgi:hypothetical protein
VAKKEESSVPRGSSPLEEPHSRPAEEAPSRGVDEGSNERAQRRRWSFDGVLRRVLGFSRAAELEGETRRSSARREPARAATPRRDEVAPPSPAFDALRLFVRSLDDETQGKLRTLMQAGRSAQALPVVVTALASERAAEGPPAPELFALGLGELQDLQRGHAVACATGFDLELELGQWGDVREPESLDERVWLRFGRELAQSRVEDWSCFAVVDSRDRLQKLYLRRGTAGWWSFAALIDRPSARGLELPRSAQAGHGRLMVLPLQAALARSVRGDLRAVRRAAMALGARLGKSRPARRTATGQKLVAKGIGLHGT